MNPKVDFYFSKNEKWEKETEKLRTIVLDCQLTEELKWGVPCYTFQKNNIVLIHDFKEYCAFLFFKGALLKIQTIFWCSKLPMYSRHARSGLPILRKSLNWNLLWKHIFTKLLKLKKQVWNLNSKRRRNSLLPKNFKIN